MIYYGKSISNIRTLKPFYFLKTIGIIVIYLLFLLFFGNIEKNIFDFFKLLLSKLFKN